MDSYKYYLKLDWQEDRYEVSKEEFIRAERGAGFHPKYGDGVATGGFSSGVISGVVECIQDEN